MKRITDEAINEFLDRLPSESAIVAGASIASQLADTRQQIKMLESKQTVNDRRILGALALAVQEQVPVSFTITRNTCHFTHRSRKNIEPLDLVVTLDWQSGRWKVEGDHRIHKRFLKHGNSIPISDESLPQLASDIAAYFSMRYKKLAKEYTPGEEVPLNVSQDEAIQSEIVDEL